MLLLRVVVVVALLRDRVFLSVIASKQVVDRSIRYMNNATALWNEN